MTNPRAIAARSTLFHWDDLQELDAHSQVAERYDYPPFISSQPLLIQHLPEEFGRQAFEHLMSNRTTRLKIIKSMLKDAGIELDASDECWQAIQKWIFDLVEPSQITLSKLGDNPTKADLLQLRGEHFTHKVWHSLIIDLSLLLADQAQLVHPQLNWVFWADSSIDDAGRFGRSPWLMINKPLTLTGEKPSRILVMSMVTGIVQNLLTHRLLDQEPAENDALCRLYSSLLSLGNKDE
ncbi:MAG: hypothetical protein AB8B79_09295 [Granulosicoccus sp.]